MKTAIEFSIQKQNKLFVKKITLFIFLILVRLFTSSGQSNFQKPNSTFASINNNSAQQTNSQTTCGSDLLFQQTIQNNPSIKLKQDDLDKKIFTILNQGNIKKNPSTTLLLFIQYRWWFILFIIMAPKTFQMLPLFKVLMI